MGMMKKSSESQQSRRPDIDVALVFNYKDQNGNAKGSNWVKVTKGFSFEVQNGDKPTHGANFTLPDEIDVHGGASIVIFREDYNAEKSNKPVGSLKGIRQSGGSKQATIASGFDMITKPKGDNGDETHCVVIPLPECVTLKGGVPLTFYWNA